MQAPFGFRWHVARLRVHSRLTAFGATAVVIAAIAACGGGGGGGGGNSQGSGQSGVSTTSTATPKTITAVGQISGGVVISDSDGRLWGFGDNRKGQLGIGSDERSVSTLTMAGDSIRHRFVALGGHDDTVMGLDTDGVLWGWGSAAFGALPGTLDQTDASPRRVASDVTAFSWGGRHALYVDRDGKVFGVGWNSSGALGSAVPENPWGPYAWAEVAQGYRQVLTNGNWSMGIKTDGTLWGWGTSEHGELLQGESGPTQKLEPRQLMADVKAVATGWRTVYAVLNDGRLYAWGTGSGPNFGDGSDTADFQTRWSPVLIGSDFTDVFTAVSHTIARKRDGSIWGWGTNLQGNLFDLPLKTPTPTRIADAHDFISVATYNTILAKADGTLKVGGVSYPGGALSIPLNPAPGGGGSGSSSGSGDALDYPLVDYAYSCTPVDGVVNRGEAQVADGPCITQQKAVVKATGCNEYGSDYTFKHVMKPYYACLVNNSSGSAKSTYQQYLDLYSR